MGAPTPTELLAAIASSAASGNITNPIPFSATGTNAASIQLGYPPVTMDPESSGGEPPLGQDENGFLNLLSSHTLALEAGQPYTYSSSLASALGGYNAGAVLGMTDGTGVWLNQDNGNTTNPDAGGAGWVPLSVFGSDTISGLTGGTVALTAVQYKFKILILTGTLTSNLTIEVPNVTGYQWLFINRTTGAFTTTVQTAAGGSTGVTIPQGGPSQPVGVYCVGDGNIYPVVAPLSVATAISPTPLTLVERDASGYVYATYFNGNAALENPPIGAVLVQHTNGDGFLRKISLANFIAQLSGAQLLAGNGYVTLPGGLKIQWGAANPNGGSVAVAYPSAFGTSVYVVIAISIANSAVQTWIPSSGTPTLTGFSLANTGGSSYWVAFGK